VSPDATPSRGLLAVSAVLATVLYAVDTTIVNVALPHMQGSLQATSDQAAWIVTGYIVMSAIATPLAGWFGARYGIRRVLLTAIAGFTVGSVLCGVAGDLTEMVLFRMLQGAFGAALVPLSQVALLQEFPRERHGRVMAMWGVGVMVGPILGPTLGGWLTDEFSWRWAFYINLPVGVLAWFGLALAMPKRHESTHRPFDVEGFVLLSLVVGLFQLMLDRGETNDWFASPETVAEAFFAVVCLYMFIVHSLTKRQPFVDIHLFKDRNFTVALVVQVAIGAFVMSPSVMLPGFLQQLQGYTPAQAGVLMASRGLASTVSMFASGRLSTQFDPRRSLAAGLLLVAVSLWMMASFSVDTPATQFVYVGLIQGLGIPLSFMPLTFIAFATLPDRSRTEAGVLITLARNIGGSAGISGAIAILSRSAQTNQSYLTEHFTPYATQRLQMLGGVPGADVSTAGFLGEVSRQALAIAYANVFGLLAVAAALCLPLLLLLGKPTPRPPVDEAAATADAAH
jgi:DHA2 family multidrug resistance protein